MITLLTLYQHQKLFSDTLSQNLNALGYNLADDLFPYVAASPPEFIELSTTLMQLERYTFIKYGKISHKNGELLAEYVSPSFTNVNLSSKNALLEAKSGGDLVITLPVGEPDFPLGWLTIVADTKKQLAKDNKAFLRQLIPLILAVILVVFIISNWVQSKLINPLISLSKLASSVSDSNNYTLRSTVEGHDEIAQLAVNMNEMLSIINTQDLENKRHTTQLLKQQQSLKSFANFDQLTRLPNRKYFSELLKQALSDANQQQHTIAVMFLDLDNFKTVNDTIGHHAGDELLIQVSIKVKGLLRGGDILARLGGDEFIIILNHIEQHVTATNVANRIINCFQDPFQIKEWKVQSGVSIGIAFNDNQQLDASALISNADVAMYRAKESGRNQFAVFENAMQSVQHRHMLIANELSNAIKLNQFKLYYQAKVCPTLGVVGLEALIRWHSDFDGWISPAEFINVAEHVGKVHDITRWVIAQGLKDVAYINQHINSKLVTSFNVSAIDVGKSDFINFIKQHIQNNNIKPKQLEFEVTETAYLENFEASTKFFKSLRDLGSSIALDDFGTGYSSLSYLTQVKANTLKIDQQFISKMFDSQDDKLIVESIVSLAKKLNLKVCAEGVEQRAEFEFIKELGCDLIQGYYFAKPVPIELLAETIEHIHMRHHFDVIARQNIVQLWSNHMSK